MRPLLLYYHVCDLSLLILIITFLLLFSLSFLFLSDNFLLAFVIIQLFLPFLVPQNLLLDIIHLSLSPAKALETTSTYATIEA